ncbi:hypothetical protein B4903_08225 [Yersinia frederiksenii]|nr:hypothetical protein B4903_08225 [Yersinia frederiksenii]
MKFFLAWIQRKKGIYSAQKGREWRKNPWSKHKTRVDYINDEKNAQNRELSRCLPSPCLFYLKGAAVKIFRDRM